MDSQDKKNLKDIVLSILFVAGEGIEKDFIIQKLGVSEKELDKALEELKKECDGDCGIHLITYKNKVQLASNPAYADFISEVLNPIREKSLTRAALETLAIIAYKQPITKLEIEDIRQVGPAGPEQGKVAAREQGRGHRQRQRDQHPGPAAPAPGHGTASPPA